jgi:acetylornithine/succinyldiaminopimelate/putrescine aminotransferase
MRDADGKDYIDLIAGISVSNVGHCHPRVVDAVREQAGRYMHLMVYGEFVEHPQTRLAASLAASLPESLSSTYFVNSGSEAVEGAMKLAKRYTGRPEIISFRDSYHGSTQGALSIMGSEAFRNPFRPLLPGTKLLDHGVTDQLDQITEKTACVIMEPVQAEAGVRVPEGSYLKAVRDRCDEVGALLVFDEIQTGFRRTGPFMAFENTGVIPDVLLLAKAMGGGMPLGAFISSPEIMGSLTHDPVLGHITTFGGHPVSCAAALAAMEIVKDIREEDIREKADLFVDKLKHSVIKEVRHCGLMIAVEFSDAETNLAVIKECIKGGVVTDWFLFSDRCMRIAPPLIISHHEIFMACDVILESIDKVVNH